MIFLIFWNTSFLYASDKKTEQIFPVFKWASICLKTAVNRTEVRQKPIWCSWFSCESGLWGLISWIFKASRGGEIWWINWKCFHSSEFQSIIQRLVPCQFWNPFHPPCWRQSFKFIKHYCRGYKFWHAYEAEGIFPEAECIHHDLHFFSYSCSSHSAYIASGGFHCHGRCCSS